MNPSTSDHVTSTATDRAPLDIWLYDTLIGQLHDAGSNRTRLIWSAEASERFGLGSRIVGHLLPIGMAGQQPSVDAVNWFIDGLLPEGNERTHRAHAVGVDPDDTFSMISRFGRDTAGALIFQQEGSPPPTTPNGERIAVGADEIGEMLSREARHGHVELSPTSLAGIQPKVGLYWDVATRGWYRWTAGGPTTHIIKAGTTPGSPLADIIDTEAACLALARTLSLTTVEAHIEQFGTARALVVTRYDRVRGADDAVNRVHQEDSAQALGINTDDMNRKFQHGRTLPSLAKIAEVLREGGTEPDRLLALTTFNLAIGNTDAHAKNISILRPADAPAVLAPTYDVAMHGHLSTHAGRFAMDINGSGDMGTLASEDLLTEAVRWRLPRRRAIRVIRETLAALDDAVQREPRAKHPGVSAHAWHTVEKRTQALSRDAARLA